MKVNESIVRAVKAPQPTRSWHPISHATLLDELEFVKSLADISITSHRYELDKNGNRFFGVWTFGNGDQKSLFDKPYGSIGFRNSIDKSLSIGLCAGTHVIVCSNLMFDGEWVEFRKHTSKVLVDLRLFIVSAFAQVMSRAERAVSWQRELDTVDLLPSQWKTLSYDSIDLGIIPPTKLPRLIEVGNQKSFDVSLGLWFNEITSMLSQLSLLTTEQRYANLKGLINDFLGN